MMGNSTMNNNKQKSRLVSDYFVFCEPIHGCIDQITFNNNISIDDYGDANDNVDAL